MTEQVLMASLFEKRRVNYQGLRVGASDGCNEMRNGLQMNQLHELKTEFNNQTGKNRLNTHTETLQNQMEKK